MFSNLVTLIIGFAVIGYADESKKPPFRSNRIAGEFLAGMGCGLAVGLIPAILFNKLYPRTPGSGPVGIPGAEFLFYLPIGYAVGSAIGVYLAGKRGSETGSFKYTLLGSLLVVVGGLAAFCCLGVPWIAIPLLMISASAVAIIIFNLTCKYRPKQ